VRAFLILYNSLEKKVRYTLGKEDKLKSRKIIEQLFTEGKSFSLFPFRIIYLLQTGNNIEINTTGKLQAGFSVGTKHFKKAVDRNRIKRLMREGYRLQKNTLETVVKNSNKDLQVFFIYTTSTIPEYSMVVEKINSAIKRLQKTIDENSTKNM
jgi:ribonuclease P protein component